MSQVTVLIDQAENVISALDLDILEQFGLSKHVETSFWPGHTIVTYPFYADLKLQPDNQQLKADLKGTPISQLNLYAHMPFCTGICGYCGYSKTANVKSDRKDAYITSIKREVDKWLFLFDNNQIALSSLYIGGGTPTDLSPGQLSAFLAYIHKKFSWSQGIEATCEGSPETLLGSLGKERLLVLKNQGINRISLGIQSFDDFISMKISNRRHTGAEAIKAIEMVQSTGFERLNIDMMYGLPQQTIQDWISSLQTSVNLGTPSITLYPFKLKDKSVWAKQHGDHSFEYTTQSLLKFSLIGKIYLESQGYQQNTVYWFTKNDDHFQQQKGKYEMKNLLGVGCSTYSFVNACQFFNVYSEVDYLRKNSSPELPVDVGRKLTSEEMEKRFLIFGIKKGLSIDTYYQIFNENIFNRFPVLHQFLSMNLIVEIDAVLYLTEIGKLFADEIGVEIHRHNLCRTNVASYE